jgi:protein phosphatase
MTGTPFAMRDVGKHDLALAMLALLNVTSLQGRNATRNVTNVSIPLQNPFGPVNAFLFTGLLVAAVAIGVIVVLVTRHRREPRHTERRDLTALLSTQPTALMSAQSFTPLVTSKGIAELERPRVRPERLEGARVPPSIADKPLVWVASKTDPGVTRDHNEDAFLVDTAAGLLLVADGVGGNRAGEVASSFAVELIAHYIDGHINDKPIENVLREAVTNANQEIYQRAAENPAWTGMGSTVVAALCGSDALYVVHAGDSRAYLVHMGAMQQITRDHTVVAELVENGQLTQEEAFVHPERHVITKSLGIQRPLQPELDFVPWGRGDYLLLCSDGLTDMVDDAAINAIVTRADIPLELKCQNLVNAANQQGGADNITVVLAYRD